MNKKQVTTAVANDIKLDEESMIANADTVAMSIISTGQNVVGSSNINQYLLTILQRTLDSRLSRFVADTSGSMYIGPQLLSYSILEIAQDPVNLDHIYAKIEIEPPRPFNKFIMTLTVI